MLQQRFRQLVQRLRPYTHTWQLAASYLAIIMIMSVSFSVVLYRVSARELGRQLSPYSLYDQFPGADPDSFTSFFEERIAHGQRDLIARLLLLNIAVLVVGALISLILARRTLEPIEAALAAQSRFAADASHELRTPLAAIQAENEVALRDPKLKLAKAKNLLASNLEEVTRLQALAAGLLALARQDTADSIDLTPVSLSGAVADAINHLLKPAQAKQLAIDDQVGKQTVLADVRALAQILNILLDNAIKYSPPRTTITISSSQHNRQVFVTIADQGIGISPADIPHIFERFYRADQSRSSQQVSGHGLGLALARRLADQLDGSITVKSSPGNGSEFTVTLPVA